MNVELNNVEFRREKGGDRSGEVEKWRRGGGGFLVDKSGGGGLDDWEVKIADFVVALMCIPD